MAVPTAAYARTQAALMDQSIYVSPPLLRLPDPPPPPTPADTPDLLRQLVELQKEQIGLLKAQLAGQDERARWKALHGRWADDFPALPAACKATLPHVEKAYLGLLAEVADKLAEADADLGDEFTLGEFLDRYAMRLAQLGNLLGPLNNLANVAPPPDAK